MGIQFPLPKQGDRASPNFRPMSIVAKRQDGSRWHSAWRYASVQATGHIVLDGDLAPSPQKREHSPQFSAHIYSGQTARWITIPLGITQVGFGLGHIVLDGDSAPPPKKRGTAPNFRPMSVVAKWLDGLRYHLVQK